MAKLLVLLVQVVVCYHLLVRKKDTCSAVKQYTLKAAVKRRGTYDQVLLLSEVNGAVPGTW